MTDPMTLREQVARAFRQKRGPIPGNPEFLAEHGERLEKRHMDAALSDADLAIALITEACAKVAEESALRMKDIGADSAAFTRMSVAQRIRQMGKP